jgi:F0F1-type ATP synthase membrane subunit c/vacuolar-type H+-ATPase subunit K
MALLESTAIYVLLVILIIIFANPLNDFFFI